MEGKLSILNSISGILDLHKEYTSVMISKEEKKILRHVFFNYDVNFSKHQQNENTEDMRIGSLGQNKVKSKAWLATSINVMPPSKVTFGNRLGLLYLFRQIGRAV